MATSKAAMGCGKASFELLYSQYLRRSAIPGIHLCPIDNRRGFNLRDSFHLLPEAPPSIDTIPMSDLKLVNFPVHIWQQILAEPFLGQSIVEARRGRSTDEDLEDHEDVNDFVDDDDFEDSCDDEDVNTCSDEDDEDDEDADESGRSRRGVRGKLD